MQPRWKVAFQRASFRGLGARVYVKQSWSTQFRSFPCPRACPLQWPRDRIGFVIIIGFSLHSIRSALFGFLYSTSSSIPEMPWSGDTSIFNRMWMSNREQPVFLSMVVLKLALALCCILCFFCCNPSCVLCKIMRKEQFIADKNSP